MAVIKSGASTDQLSVDAVSKAARVTIYNSAGTEQTTQPVSGTVAVSNFPATQPISAAALPLPSGASTEATLALVKAKTDNLDVALSTRLKPADTLTAVTTVGTITNPVAVTGTFFQGTQPVSGTITATQATGTNLHTVVDSGTITTVSTVTNLSQLGGTAVSMNTGTRDAGTQRVTIATNDLVPISAASLPLPSGAATSAAQALNLQESTFTGRINTQGQKTMAASTPVVLASDQTVIPVSDNAGSLTIDAPVGTPVAARLSDGTAFLTTTLGALVETPRIDATYRASTATAQSGVVVAAASAAPFFAIQGSATKTVTVHRIYVSGATTTAVGYLVYVLAKYSTAITAGTATALTKTPLDSTSAASTVNLCNVYTAAPTAGTLVGTLSTKRTLSQATVAAAAGIPDIVEFDFRTLGSPTSGIVLRGIAEGLALNFGAAPATAATVSVTVEWTEV